LEHRARRGHLKKLPDKFPYFRKLLKNRRLTGLTSFPEGMARALLIYETATQHAKPKSERVAVCWKETFEEKIIMNRFKNLLAVFAFSLLILGLPTLASAQWRDNDDYGNDRYRNNRNYNRGNLRSAINRLANRAEVFERRLDRELDRSRYDNRNREDRLNRLANDFTRAAERLEDEFDGGRDAGDSYDEAQRVLQLGRQLDNALSRARLSGYAMNDWNAIRQDLNTIANAYGSNNRNRRRNGNNGRDWRDYLPY
jgi:hypothetical protein